MKKLVSIIVLASFLLALTHTQTICSPGCARCPTILTCSSCQLGFFLVNQTFCSPCPIGCTNCTQGTNGAPFCSSCAAPAQLDQTTGKCFLCNPICLTCSNRPDNCVTCRDGFTINITNGIGSCVLSVNCSILNCAQCSIPNIQGISYCNRCLSGYFDFGQGCLPCRFPCSSCLLDRNQIWNSIVAPHWTRVLNQTFNGTNIPQNFTTPSFMDSLNFSSMQPEVQRAWTQAYFIYQYLAPILSTSPTNITQTQFLLMAGMMASRVDNLTAQQKKSLIIMKFNQLTGMNLTQAILRQRTAILVANVTSCSQCSTGYQLMTSSLTNTPPLCSVCSVGCLTCGSGACLTCQDGFFLVQGTCSPCVAPCLACTSRTTCTKCYAPLVLSSGTCNLCKQTCATCSATNSSLCLTCKLPYSSTPNSLGDCYRCVQDLCNNCQQTNRSVCLECRLGATLTNGICSLCPVNCATCSPATSTTNATCFICNTGFQLSTDGKCVSCSPGCLRCSDTNASICIECLPGAFLNTTSGKCQRCKQGCLLCTSYQTCTQFEWGQVQINSEVVKCRPGCKYCSPTDSAICTQCQPRYYLSSDNCFPCGPGCQTCSSSTVCTKCLINLNLAAGICTECLGNCRTCSTSDSSSCLTCKRGYTLVGTQCVHQCSRGCLQCDANNSTNCKICAQGHSLKADGTCVKCLQSCRGTCDASNINICLNCLNGFQLKQNKCVRCPSGCSTCLNGQCLTCLQGYSFSQTTTGSFICSLICKFPCSVCTETGCTKCSAGYTLNNGLCTPNFPSCNPSCDYCPPGTQRDVANNNCTRCPAGCGACQSGVCIQCIDGFYKNSTGSCVPCSTECRTCYDATRCKQCSAGYVKQIVSMVSGAQDATYSDKCISCSSNCKTCAVEPQRCTSCNTGYRLYFYRCAGVFNVVYKFQINQNYAQFLNSSQSQRFIQTLANQTQRDIKDIYITQITSGSTIISGSISTQNQNSASTLQQSLGSSSVPGYNVISSSASVYLEDQPFEEQQEQEQGKGKMLGAIIGGAVGGIVLVAVIAFIVYKCRISKAGTSSQQRVAEENTLNNNTNVTEQNIKQEQRYQSNFLQVKQ